jgi:hypothetical protein
MSPHGRYHRRVAIRPRLSLECNEQSSRPRLPSNADLPEHRELLHRRRKTKRTTTTTTISIRDAPSVLMCLCPFAVASLSGMLCSRPPPPKPGEKERCSKWLYSRVDTSRPLRHTSCSMRQVAPKGTHTHSSPSSELRLTPVILQPSQSSHNAPPCMSESDDWYVFGEEWEYDDTYSTRSSMYNVTTRAKRTKLCLSLPLQQRRPGRNSP